MLVAGEFRMFIEDFGWNAYFEARWKTEERAAHLPARVIAQHRGLWRISGDFEECWAEASGKLRLDAEAGGDWPAVGDWVAAENCIRGANAAIQSVLPRCSKFSRKEAGKRVAEQVIAANVDQAAIVAGLDGDFNPRRIERYLAQCWDSGARPVIVLNKADQCADQREYVRSMEGLAMGAPVFVLSARTGAGMSEFAASLRKGETVVFLGSSGVGKSTLVNWLLRRDMQTTRPVREGDSRGRHTTTARELFALPNGALVIDTPGLRELQLWEADEGVTQAFAEIADIAARCKFRNCSHQGEPGCAVAAALQSGVLHPQRLASLRKLQREQEFLLRKTDTEKQHEHKKKIKILFRQIRQNVNSKDKNKG
jgi:ribosome biogenesis GTPase